MKYIKDKSANANLPSRQADNEDMINFPGYPLYPVNEDIYNKGLVEESVDPENISRIKVFNENKFNGDVSGNDLDVPGSELDDDQENVGSEDEENNSYSLGGDDHNDLEEDNGD